MAPLIDVDKFECGAHAWWHVSHHRRSAPSLHHPTNGNFQPKLLAIHSVIPWFGTPRRCLIVHISFNDLDRYRPDYLFKTYHQVLIFLSLIVFVYNLQPFYHYFFNNLNSIVYIQQLIDVTMFSLAFSFRFYYIIEFPSLIYQFNTPTFSHK